MAVSNAGPASGEQQAEDLLCCLAPRRLGGKDSGQRQQDDEQRPQGNRPGIDKKYEGEGRMHALDTAQRADATGISSARCQGPVW
jgi:hypothetical protein